MYLARQEAGLRRKIKQQEKVQAAKSGKKRSPKTSSKRADAVGLSMMSR